MANQDEFIAFERTVEQVGEWLGATSLAYLSLEGLLKAIGMGGDGFCTACFSGSYPCAVPEEVRMSKLRFERSAERTR